MRKFDFIAEGLSDAVDEQELFENWDWDYMDDNYLYDDSPLRTHEALQKENEGFKERCRLCDSFYQKIAEKEDTDHMSWTEYMDNLCDD